VTVFPIAGSTHVTMYTSARISEDVVTQRLDSNFDDMRRAINRAALLAI